MSNFERDLAQEGIPVSFLARYFYPYISKTYKIYPEFISDSRLQHQGIDIIHHYINGAVYYVDAKAQMNGYINHPTRTFCLELEYEKDGALKTGWFLNNRLQTQCYLFIWITDAVTDSKHLLHSPEDINEMQIAFVDKKKAMETLTSLIDLNNISKKMRMLKDNPEENGCKKLFLSRDLKLVQTMFLPEKPINLVVPNSIWDKICSAKYIVEKESVKVQKEAYKWR